VYIADYEPEISIKGSYASQPTERRYLLALSHPRRNPEALYNAKQCEILNNRQAKVA
jgi:hypothetical protein